jgi:hypothetical protein
VFDCDPSFYITWFGTDKNGKSFKSSNMSMSRFRQYSIGSLYNSVKSSLNVTVQKLKDTYNDISSTIDKMMNK